MNGDLVYRKKGELVARRIAGETLIVPIRGRLADMQKIYALNEVAEFVWEQIDGVRNLEHLGRSVSERFEVDSSSATADVRELIGEMTGEGLIESV